MERNKQKIMIVGLRLVVTTSIISKLEKDYDITIVDENNPLSNSYVDPIVIKNPYKPHMKDLDTYHSKKEEKYKATYNETHSHMSNKRKTLNDLYKEIQLKQSELSRRCRDFVLSHYDSDGKFIE